jgi:hypothetical protein
VNRLEADVKVVNDLLGEVGGCECHLSTTNGRATAGNVRMIAFINTMI